MNPLAISADASVVAAASSFGRSNNSADVPFRVGQRVRHAELGNRGTVQFIGQLEAAAITAARGVTGSGIDHHQHHQQQDNQRNSHAVDEVVGVAWDEPVGKHDGAVNGHRYFTCAPLHGSLLKRGAKLQGGMSLVSALHDRFSVSYDANCKTQGANPFFRDPSRNMAFINVRSADSAASSDFLSVSCDETPSDAALLLLALPATNSDARTSPSSVASRSSNADSTRCLAEDGGGSRPISPTLVHHSVLNTLFPNLTAVNLSKTLLQSWAAVEQLCLSLPHLKTLGVASNRFDLSAAKKDDEGQHSQHQQAESAADGSDGAAAGGNTVGAMPSRTRTWSSSLTILDVWGTHLTRMQWMELLSACPSLTELHAGFNPQLFNTFSTDADHAAGSRAWMQQNQLSSVVARRVGIAMTSCLQLVSFEQCDIVKMNDVVRFLTEGVEFPTTTSTGAALAFSLKTINLSNNAIRSLAIASTLHVNGSQSDTLTIQMRLIHSDDRSAAAEQEEGELLLFRHVRHLLLRRNHFSDWNDITEPLLLFFTAVDELHLSHCPVIAAQHGLDDAAALRKKMIAILPFSMKKLNNSVITPNERFGIERFALLEYLAPYQKQCDALASLSSSSTSTSGHAQQQQASSSSGSSCNEHALAALCHPCGLQRLVRKILDDQHRLSGECLTVFVPRPRMLQTTMSLHVVSLNLTLIDMLQLRLRDGFFGAVKAHRQAWAGKAASASASLYRANIDVRWTVRELEAFLCAHIGLSQVLPSAGSRGSDFWSFADLILRRSIATPADPEVSQAESASVDRMLPNNAKTLFPRGSVVLFHIDSELMENEGARARGMHCKHLVRHDDKLHQFRVNDDDALVTVTLL